MICENCEIEHSGEFGSGRFCSLKCSRAFSTKSKRAEINNKIAKAAKLRANPDVIKHCKFCKNEFTISFSKRHQQFCSHSCSVKFVSPETREKLSKARVLSMVSGKINGSGIKSMYKFGDFEIPCDSNIERACLNYFEKLGATSIERCKDPILYSDNGRIRRFLPDFRIELNSKIYIVEAKSYMSIKTIDERWREYNRLAELKKAALKIHCIENGFEQVWFTKDMNLKYYTSLNKKK